MRLLLDECVPRGFKASLTTDEHQCLTVPEAGFAGKTNGELLTLAEAGFDVFVTLDKGFRYQQNLADRRIALLVIRAKSRRLVDLLPCAQKCLAAMAAIKSGEVIQVGD